MPWIKTPNVAQFEGSNWENYVKTVPNCTATQAQLIAFRDPSISYFFFCREPISLTNGRSFNPGDAVFFNGTQQPWYGSAPQCDSYKRLCLAVGYADTKSFKDVAALTFNGSPALDAIILFANLNLKSTSMPTGCSWIDPKGQGPTMLRANPNVMQFLESDEIKQARKNGIAVVLSGLNNHDDAGWSEFTNQADAEQFAIQCQYALETYGLDGIDIDDEYSAAPQLPDSLAMSTYYVRKTVGSASLSKALFADTNFFMPQQYNGSSLGTNLTRAWTMSYGASPQEQLSPYANLVTTNRLSCGFQSGYYVPQPSDIKWMYDNGYAGVMLYNMADNANQQLLHTLLSYWNEAMNPP